MSTRGRGLVPAVITPLAPVFTKPASDLLKDTLLDITRVHSCIYRKTTLLQTTGFRFQQEKTRLIQTNTNTIKSTFNK